MAPTMAPTMASTAQQSSPMAQATTHATQASADARHARDGVERALPGEPGAWRMQGGAALARCPLCRGALSQVPGMPEYVRHKSARRAAQCVLSTARYQPDELAVNGSRNAVISAMNRRRFLEGWERHYLAMRVTWPPLSIARFTTVLSCADVLDLWSYPELREADVPAVLLVLAGFLRVPEEDAFVQPRVTDLTDVTQVADVTERVGSEARWVRFWFGANVHDAADLWKPQDTPPALFRVDYRDAKSTPFPTGAHVLACTRVGDASDPWHRQPDAAPMLSVSADERRAVAHYVARSHEYRME